MNGPPYHLTIGTHNAAKGVELAELVAQHGFDIRTLADFPEAHEVEEDGATFAENARKKAVEYAARLNCWVLADDSGIEVDALDGRPGVYSARYAGDDATDEKNNQKLLDELGDLPPQRRAARYVCHVVVASPDGQVRAEACDVCHGRIRDQPAGANGFGYDPLFEVREFHQTFGQLGPAVKKVLSHRARAMRAIVPKLLSLAGGRAGSDDGAVAGDSS